MKRSEVNQIIGQANAFMRSFGVQLPPFAYWAPEQMQARRAEISAIIAARTGWDITDYGKGDFKNLGLFLFTIRNGTPVDPRKCYAEKIMISRQNQISPMHRHLVKSEDIINRGGAVLALKMFTSDAAGNLDRKGDVVVETDGITRRLKAGEVLRLSPGESVTLHPGNWHEFWGEGGDVLIGEVSSVNDDTIDNIFEPPLGRFASIEEDEPPLHLLVSDYETWLKP